MSDERILTGEQFTQALGQFLLDRNYSGLLESHEAIRAERGALATRVAALEQAVRVMLADFDHAYGNGIGSSHILKRGFDALTAALAPATPPTAPNPEPGVPNRDEDGHCCICGELWPDERDTLEPHECPPGFLVSREKKGAE